MISIHQSQFLAWIPYYYKILQSDIFIVLDNVQYQKNGVQNRNQIKTPNGALWLTLPIIKDFGQNINETKLADYDKNKSKILKTIEMNYLKSKYYNEIMPNLINIFDSEISDLHQLNNKILLYFLDLLKIDTKILYSSNFETISKKDGLVLELINKTHEKQYISGSGGLEYMDLEKFKKDNIEIFLCEFHHKEYHQLWNKLGFLENLSIIDLLFNNLPNAKEYIKTCGNLKKVEF